MDAAAARLNPAIIIENKKNIKTSYAAGLAVFAAYLAAAVFYTGFYGHDVFSFMLNISGDPDHYILFMKWWPWAVLHHKNPFLTDYITYPRTYNLAWVTSVPFLSLVAYPVTRFFGIIFAWNVLMLLAPVTAALAAYGLFRYMRLGYIPSFAGGYIFGFSTYEMSQLLAHIFLLYIFPVPLLIALVLMRFDGKIGRIKFVVLAGLLFVALLGASTEIITTFVIFSFLSLLVFALFYFYYKDKAALKRIYSVSLDFTLGGILAAAIASPFIYYLITGLKNIKGPINSSEYYSADLLNYFVPTPTTLFGRDVFKSIAFHFNGNFSEKGAYIGLGLLIISILSMMERRGKRWLMPAVIVTAMLVVFSFGIRLRVNGVDTGIPLPWFLFNFPPLNNALPIRFTMYVFLAAGFWVALWLQNGGNIKPGRLKIKRYFWAAVGLALIIPNYHAYYWMKPAFNKNFIRKNIPAGSNILPIPSNPYGQGSLWVAGSDFRISMTGPVFGYDDYKNYWVARGMLDENRITESDYKRQLSAFCAVHDIKYVVLSPSTPKIEKTWEDILNGMGWKYKIHKGVFIYKVPERIFAEYKNIDPKELASESLLSNFSEFYASALNFLKAGSLKTLYPKNLESLGYLNKSFGHKRGKLNNWTITGGWIGKWSCPDGKGGCFGIGLTGGMDALLPVINRYKAKAVGVFFPFPEKYDPKSALKKKGQLIMIFRAPLSNYDIKKLPYAVDFRKPAAKGRVKAGIACWSRLDNKGFCQPEDWGTWSCSKKLSIGFYFNPLLPPTKPVFIKLKFNAFASAKHPQKFLFYLNGRLLGSRVYADNGPHELYFNLSGLIKRKNILAVAIPDAASPKSLGLSGDERSLGIGLIRVEVADGMGRMG